MAKQDDYIRYTVRLPAPLYDLIKFEADQEGRSVNAEIIDRLDRTIYSHGPTRGDDGRLTDEFRSKISDMVAVLKSVLEEDKKK